VQDNIAFGDPFRVIVFRVATPVRSIGGADGFPWLLASRKSMCAALTGLITIAREDAMTRHRLNGTLRRAYVGLSLVLIVSLVTKLAPHIPGIAGSPIEAIAKDVYEYLKDMALVFVTVVAAYLANVFQKRSNFIEGLEEQWRSIVATRSALYGYFEKPYPTLDDYIATYRTLSETIDSMRIIYRNVGETRLLVGLYPYAPLHDMRRVLADMDPRTKATFTAEERQLASAAIQQLFAALRETFLEELDLQEPDHPLLISGGRRLKASGQTSVASSRHRRQRDLRDKRTASDPAIDALLDRLYAQDHAARPAPGHPLSTNPGQDRAGEV
jgi:hypothetical protein